MAVNKKIAIFWDMTICSKTVEYYRFAAAFSYHCPSRKDPEDGGNNFLRNSLRTHSISFFFISFLFWLLQYGACALHAGYLRLQTHTQNMQHLLIFHCNNGCKHAPQCYVTVHCLSCLLLPYCSCIR